MKKYKNNLDKLISEFNLEFTKEDRIELSRRFMGSLKDIYKKDQLIKDNDMQRV